MPTSKGSGKKGRWSAARKADAKRSKPSSHRGKAPRAERSERTSRPERPQRAPRSAASDGKTRTARPERSDRTARPERSDRTARPERSDRTSRPERPERGVREDSRRGSWAPRDDTARAAQARTYDKPRWERPVRADRPDRGSHGRVADPARRDRHEGHRADRFADRAGERPGDQERAEADTWTAYTSARAGGAVAVTADNGFAALGVPDRLVERLARDGITEPFPIQAATIPDALAGRDVLGRGRTGSGKTLAFGLPTLARLLDGRPARSKQPRVLILVPTRELAMQVSDALEPLVHVMGLRHRLVAGGLSYEPQISSLARGVELLIATPGRLADLIEKGACDLGAVETVILDEADHMADMGFLPEVTALLDQIPAGGQRLLFSATLDNGVDALVERYLVDPVTHSTDDVTAAVTTMDHHIVLIDPRDKKALTAELANRPARSIVFVRTQMGADRVALELRERGVLAASLHGGLTQSVRNRVLGAFREGNLRVLVATDVAARGIHVDDVGLVLQVDPPRDFKDYLHRAGRTARAGEKGTVVTLVLPHQKRMMSRLVESAGADATSATVRPGDATVADLGGSEPSGVPIPDHAWRPLLEGRPGRDRGSRGPRGPGRGGPRPTSGAPRRPSGTGGSPRRGPRAEWKGER